MSDDDAADEPSGLETLVRTVTPGYEAREDVEMNVVGWSFFLVLLLLFPPLLPLIVVIWLVSKVVEFLASIPGEDQTPSRSNSVPAPSASARS